MEAAQTVPLQTTPSTDTAQRKSPGRALWWEAHSKTGYRGNKNSIAVRKTPVAFWEKRASWERSERISYPPVI